MYVGSHHPSLSLALHADPLNSTVNFNYQSEFKIPLYEGPKWGYRIVYSSGTEKKVYRVHPILFFTRPYKKVFLHFFSTVRISHEKKKTESGV